MSESSQNYTPSQILAIGQRAESEGRLEYAAQFYSHLADHFRHTPEGHEAIYGLRRIEQYRQAQAAAQRSTQTQPPRREAPRSQQQATRPTAPQASAGGRPAARTARAYAPEWLAAQERPVASGGVAASFSPPARVSDEEEDELAPLPRLVTRSGKFGEDGPGTSGYRIGRFLATVLAAAGWVLLTVGFVLLLAGLAGVHSSVSAAGLVGFPRGVELGVVMFAFGYIMVFAAHLARAVFDSAVACRELVEIERAKAGL